VKANQPALLADLEAAFGGIDAARERGQGALPPYLEREWREEGVVYERYREVSIGHGRFEERTIEIVADPERNGSAGSAGTVGEPWPHLSQIARLERRRTIRGTTTTEVAFLITSLSRTEADARAVLAYSRSHWGIENGLNWVRDVTFGEDRSQVRSGSAPQVKAALTNLTMTLLRRNGATNVAAALRTYSARFTHALALVLSAPIPL